MVPPDSFAFCAEPMLRVLPGGLWGPGIPGQGTAGPAKTDCLPSCLSPKSVVALVDLTNYFYKQTAFLSYNSRTISCTGFAYVPRIVRPSPPPTFITFSPPRRKARVH